MRDTLRRELLSVVLLSAAIATAFAPIAVAQAERGPVPEDHVTYAYSDVECAHPQHDATGMRCEHIRVSS
jgi:hypothetical protein